MLSFILFCAFNLKNNLRERLNKECQPSYRDCIVSKFTSCAYAATGELFNEKMEELEADFDGITHYLTDLPYLSWSNVHFLGSRYGEMTSNVAVES